MGNGYLVQIVGSARKNLLRIPEPHRERIQRAIRELAMEPRPAGVVRLSGNAPAPTWRIRVGDYRVLYEIQDDRLLVLAIRIDHRGTVYRMR